MNLFETVKESVTLRQAAEAYGMDVKRNGMMCCPFHNDSNPSLNLYDDHFYCFGCGEHGDFIDFVGKVFSLSPKEAAESLAKSFGICYNSDERLDTSKNRKDSIVFKIRISQEKEKENHVYKVLSSYLRLLQDWKHDYAPVSPDDVVDYRFSEALTKTAYIEHLLDSMISENKENIGNIITDSEIVKIEKIVKKCVGSLPKEQVII